MWFARALVRRTNLHDTVGVNLEDDFDLGDTGGRGAGELWFAEEVVVLCRRTLSFVYSDEDNLLVVSGSREVGGRYSE